MNRVNPKAQRLERIEAALESIQLFLDVPFKPVAAMQAEVNLLRGQQRSS